MKTIHYSIIVAGLTICGISAIHSTDLAFAEKTKSSFDVDGNKINYESTNANITDVKFDPQSASLVFNITSDKVQNGSMTLVMSQEQINALFGKGPRCEIQPPFNQLYLLVDGRESDYKITADKYISMKFDIPSGSEEVEIIGGGIIGQGDGPQIKGIPESDIYRPGQQVAWNGVLEDYCGNVISDAAIYLDVKNIESLSQNTTTDSLGRFTINFTIPPDSESGRYKATLYGIKQNLNAMQITTLLVQKNGETNIPFLFNTDFGSFEIPYHFEHGEIVDVSQYFAGNSMSIRYYAAQNGTMEILFPKTLVDLVSGNVGTITVRTGDQYIDNFPEHTDSENHRIFDIPVYEGRNFIDISMHQEGGHPAYNNSGLHVLLVGDKLYPIPYNITGGIIQNLGADIFHKKIQVETIGAPPGGGHLRLELPRNIFDSIQDGQDKKFVVTNTLINNGLLTGTKSIGYTESNATAKSRVLEINFPQYQSITDIQGTTIIPEFSFVTPILLVGMVSVIVFYRMRFRK
ncbi:MAG: hypothetical protein KGH87_01060 [Thaumarchaeota archaeon]|nr:hypothetical protein [Nitrososphaerota archaeon]